MPLMRLVEENDTMYVAFARFDDELPEGTLSTRSAVFATEEEACQKVAEWIFERYGEPERRAYANDFDDAHEMLSREFGYLKYVYPCDSGKAMDFWMKDDLRQGYAIVPIGFSEDFHVPFI